MPPTVRSPRDPRGPHLRETRRQTCSLGRVSRIGSGGRGGRIRSGGRSDISAGAVGSGTGHATLEGSPADPDGGSHRPGRRHAPPGPPPRKTPRHVPSAPTVDELDDALLETIFDAGSLERGRAYADEDRSTILSVEPGVIKAVCAGSGQNSYVQWIKWTHGAGYLQIDDTCTCPVGEGCKHCVAAILTARRDAAESEAPADGTVEIDWRGILHGLATADDEVDDEAMTGLALQVVLENPPPSRYLAHIGPRVTIRPMRRGKGKTANWIRTGASWRDITSPHGSTLEDVDPMQRAALKSLTASGPPDLAYGNIQTAPLARFDPDLWFQLERAVDVGVVLIGEHAGDTATLSPSKATASVDLTADENGDVTLSARFVLDGEPLVLEEESSGLLGTPPHGLWIRDGGRIDLIPLDAPLHPAVARLAASGRLTVPAADVDELLDVYQPELARHAAVASPDSSVTIATNQFDGLVLTIERTALAVASLRWAARYRRGERVVDHPLNWPGGRGRDRTEEVEAVDALELPTHLLPELVDYNGSPRDTTVSGAKAITLLTEVVPWLEAKSGVVVEVVGDQPDAARGHRRPARLADRHRRRDRRRDRRARQRGPPGHQRLVRPRRGRHRRRPVRRLRHPLRRSRPQRRGPHPPVGHVAAPRPPRARPPAPAHRGGPRPGRPHRHRGRPPQPLPDQLVGRAHRVRRGHRAVPALGRQRHADGEPHRPGAGSRSARPRGHAAALPAGGPRLAGVPAPQRARRDPRRRHGPGEDRPDPRPLPPRAGAEARRPLPRRRPHQRGRELGPGGRPLRPRPRRAHHPRDRDPPGPRPRRRDRRRQPRRHLLRPVPLGVRGLRRPRLGAPPPRRGPVRQEPPGQDLPVRPPPRRRHQDRHHRHPAREHADGPVVAAVDHRPRPLSRPEALQRHLPQAHRAR